MSRSCSCSGASGRWKRKPCASSQPIASGPTFLAVGLSADLHGRTAVAYSALAFLAGSLLASRAATRLEDRGLPAPFLWPALGAVVAAGWILAPISVAGLVVAQFVAGAALPALEGTIDSAVAGREHGGRVTAGLAWAGASRALGTAAAVGVAPTLFDRLGVSLTCLCLAITCVAAALVGGIVAMRRLNRRRLRSRIERVLFDGATVSAGRSNGRRAHA